MNLNDTNLSLQFFEYLCDIIGSEEVVRTRREIFSAREILDNSIEITSISSGSKAEGLDLKGSDYDTMLLMNFFRVYESLNDVHYDLDNASLVMDTHDTKPGFTKLKLVNKALLEHDVINNWCETVGGETYISSKSFREQDLPDDMVIHGPCWSTASGDYDYASCFRCKEWIYAAQQWISRSRTTWPHHALVTSSVQYGVLFVPVGCKNSPNEDLQWRVSYSMTEKMLIHSFTHTQLLCYALMKMVLQDLIKPKHGELLCSYFVKTIMFWLSEEINPSEWKPENMISCFLNCIRRLIYCVEYKTCLHYFIPENNLFENRFVDKEHDSLLNTLRFIYGSPLVSVFETFTCQNYRLESANSHGMILSASELSCYCYLDRQIESSNDISIKLLVKVGVNKELITHMLYVYAREVLESSYCCKLIARNKLFYQQYNRSLCYLKINIRSLPMSAWLLLASLFYKSKRFQECRVIINYFLSRCSPDMIHLNFTNSLVEQTLFKDMKHRCGLLLTFKNLVIINVCFRHPFCLLPDELMPLIHGKKMFIPPVVYSYLLQFLCCHQLGNYRGKQNALHDLQLTIREQYFILDNVLTSRLVRASLDIVKALL